MVGKSYLPSQSLVAFSCSPPSSLSGLHSSSASASVVPRLSRGSPPPRGIAAQSPRCLSLHSWERTAHLQTAARSMLPEVRGQIVRYCVGGPGNAHEGGLFIVLVVNIRTVDTELPHLHIYNKYYACLCVIMCVYHVSMHTMNRLGFSCWTITNILDFLLLKIS